MFPQLGAPVGFIAANGLFLLLGLLPDRRAVQGLGLARAVPAERVLVGLGLWVRLKLSETPAFAAALAEGRRPRVPLGEVLARPSAARRSAARSRVVACFAIFYISTAFALGYGIGTLGYGRETFLGVQLGAICSWRGHPGGRLAVGRGRSAPRC